VSRTLPLLFALMLVACDDGPAEPTDGGVTPTDAGPRPPTEPLSTDHCEYAPLPATAGAGGTVAAGPIEVGLAELVLDLPVGTALGGNTSRAAPLDNQGDVDGRQVFLSGEFTPSVGIETIPEVKAVALRAGDETMVLIRTDTIFADDTITHAVTERLGPELAGKVLWMASHTHTAPAQYSADLKFQVGAGPIRGSVRERLIERMVEAAEQALGAMVPARLGIAVMTEFDPDDRVSYDRRPENDHLHEGRSGKDDEVVLIRIDAMDGTPMAILPIFGVHSAILDDDVSVYSTDASGMYERLLEEQFDHEVMVVHLQGAAGDVLGSSGGHLAYEDGEPRWDFARNEENGWWALPDFMALWERAGESMVDSIELEMVTRSVEMGPDWETFTVRGGALEYAPWDGLRGPDGMVFGPGDEVLSPIDEFNAPAGAALCGDFDSAQVDIARMPGTRNLGPYHSCAMIPKATEILGILLDMEFGDAEPLCPSTRTTISAIRLGEYLFATAPGEPVVPWARGVRERSPFGYENTYVLGYAQGHNGYILEPEDWLQGGFEPSINSWGPLEGAYLGERIVELLELAATDAREDATIDGVGYVVAPSFDDGITRDPDPAPMAGTVPGSVPEQVYFRGPAQPTDPQPAPTLERVHGVARFVWIGEDPSSGTPRVRLEREVDGTFEPARRRSGRLVDDWDLITVWTPLPLREQDDPRTHYWTVEWQAVSWLGGVEDRPSTPLGRYRFHVEGTGYAIDSEPFEVVPATLNVTASMEGADVVANVGFSPREGWRLIAMEGIVNRDVPLQAGPVTVELHRGAEVETIEDVALASPGAVRVTPAETGAIDRVVVIDAHGNRGEASL